MAKAKRDLPEPQSPYDRDFFAWTQQQADLLRRAAARERTPDLDFENLAEEIESLGKRDRRALASQIARITEHLLKLQYSRAEESRPGWENSVDVHRSKARRILADSPGLKGELETILKESYEDGRRFAARSLRTELDPKTLPEVCPYRLDQILDRDWWPRRG
jgi:Domain of unknown function DUF29